MRGEVVILLGGPVDGRELTLRPEEGYGPETINVPGIISEVTWNADPNLDATYRVAVYRKERCLGWPSRDDQGRIRYVIEGKT